MEKKFSQAEKFVLALKAAFPYMSKDAVSLYHKSVSKWHLTQAQWDAALEALTSMETDGNPPQLSTVNFELHRQTIINKPNASLGWAYFDLNGTSYAIRIKSDGSQWAIADLIHKDSNGNQIHCQAHVGEPLGDRIPVDAENYVLAADNPARPEGWQIPTPDEVKEYMRTIWANLLKMGRAA